MKTTSTASTVPAKTASRAFEASNAVTAIASLWKNASSHTPAEARGHRATRANIPANTRKPNIRQVSTQSVSGDAERTTGTDDTNAPTAPIEARNMSPRPSRSRQAGTVEEEDKASIWQSPICTAQSGGPAKTIIGWLPVNLPLLSNCLRFVNDSAKHADWPLLAALSPMAAGSGRPTAAPRLCRKRPFAPRQSLGPRSLSGNVSQISHISGHSAVHCCI
ncbi:hypothetical protein SAMN05444168_5283 [Paraburkholderia phenazinium]|uniref:Uncharacterized protein n=1 Tax=Paraburkholderia phenazinium TaxID=60549 RepID=A0A1N6JX69_9BURK|nr:hypothetical protein SAMN05444168_5283 [Paraburkholderia phenazinium]